MLSPMTLESAIKRIIELLSKDTRINANLLVDTLGKINIFIIDDVKEDEINARLTSVSLWIGMITYWNDFQNYLENEQYKDINGYRIYSKHTFLDSWSNDGQKFQKKSKIVSFYSYKGGVGRTTLAIMTALELSKNYKVALIDLDLEAPGVIFQFFSTDSKEDIKNFEGFLDYWLYPDSNDAEFKERFGDSFFYNNVSFFPNLFIMPSGKISKVEDYYEKISRANFVQNASEKINQFIQLIDDTIQPDIILFDLRTGLTDIGGLMTSSNCSDLDVFVGYPDNQSEIGLEFFLNRRKVYIDKKPRMLFCYSPAPLDPINQKIIETEIDKFKEIINRFIDEEDKGEFLAQDSLKTLFAIPYTYNLRSLIREKGIFDIFTQAKVDTSYYEEFGQAIQAYLELKQGVQKASTSDEESIKNKIFTELSNAFSDENTKFRFNTGAEVDLNTPEKIKLNFQPIVDYGNILKDQVFIVIGEKGSGKSALEQVFKNSSISDSVLQSLKIHHRKNSIVWLSAIDEHLLKDIFDRAYPYIDAITGLINEGIFWKCYIVGIIEYYLSHSSDSSIDLQMQKEIIKQLAQDYEQIGAKECNRKYDFDSIMEKLKNSQKPKIVMAFDYLDSYDDSGMKDNFDRYELIKDLVLFFYAKQRDDIRKYLTAKIFLRDDILDRIKFDDIGKIKTNHAYIIQLDFYKIMSIVLKRLCQRSEALKTYAGQIQLIDPNQSEGEIGVVIKDERELIKKTLRFLFSDYITSNLTENFIWRYLWIGKKLNGIEVFNLRVALNFFSMIFDKPLEPYESGIINLYKPLSDDIQIYCRVAKDWVDDELKIMYKEKASYIETLKSATKTDSNAFSSGRVKFSFLKTLFTDDTVSICKELESIGVLAVEKGNYDSTDKLIFNIPEIYRVYFGIVKANGLRPCRL